MILPNELRPKYSPRMDVLIGLRPPKPIPNIIAKTEDYCKTGDA